MSIRAIAIVLESPLGPPTRKLAAVVLADWCNDEGGSLHPSMGQIAKKVGVSRSQAQRIVHSLVSDGLLSVVGNANGGSPGTTPRYQLHLERFTGMAPHTGRMGATGSTDATGRMDAQEGPHGCAGGVAPMRQTGSTDATQTVKNRQRTTKEPSGRAARSSPKQLSLKQLLAEGVPEEVAAEFLALRKTRRAPLTPMAWEGIRRQATLAGWSLEQVLRKCIERGWQSFEVAWVQQSRGTARVFDANYEEGVTDDGRIA